ncbi:hypothetical protein GOODEAATRI_009670, partial [Goodea atripinnis]
LEQYLALRWAEGHQLITDSTAPPISKEVSEDVIEILKTIFNIAHRFYRQEPDEILPPLRDVAVRPEQDSTLRGQLVRLMTHVDTDVKDCAAELLFVLCKENGTVTVL